jgi:hypothetical protein
VRAHDNQAIRLPVPISLLELARHLATGKHFVLEPCNPRQVGTLQIVAAPYGYAASLVEGTRAILLRYLGQRRGSESEESGVSGSILPLVQPDTSVCAHSLIRLAPRPKV